MNTSGVASSTAARTAVATGSMEESILALDGPIIVTPTKVDAVGDHGAKDELVGKHEHQRSVDDAGGGHCELPDLAADDVHQDAGYELTPCKGVHRAVGGEQVLGVHAVEREKECREQADYEAGRGDGEGVQVAVGGYGENAGERADNGYYLLNARELAVSDRGVDDYHSRGEVLKGDSGGGRWYAGRPACRSTGSCRRRTGRR